MASIRDQIADALVAQLDAIDGVTAYRRDVVTSMNFEGVVCVVNLLGETKRLVAELYYDCDLRIGITILANREDADPVLDGSLEMRYLDRCIANVERAVHATTWPLADTRPVIVGNDTTAPGEVNQVVARLELQVPYRHNWDDPDTYNPAFA